MLQPGTRVRVQVAGYDFEGEIESAEPLTPCNDKLVRYEIWCDEAEVMVTVTTLKATVEAI